MSMIQPSATTPDTFCPVCKERLPEPLKRHVHEDHSLEEIEQAILKEREKGTGDREIGRLFHVTYRQLERIVTKHTGSNTSRYRADRNLKALGPANFVEEKTTVWSFKSRGNWATHNGDYRGNWSPYIPRNLILKYSNSGDIVLDYFCGAGTTAVEAKLLGRRFIGVDINEHATELSELGSTFEVPIEGSNSVQQVFEPEFRVGDARNLNGIKDKSIDFICAHPPYANIINYSSDLDGDLSLLPVDEFIGQMEQVARESFRVLKPGKKCAILIGDTRQKKHVVPMGFGTIQAFLKAGFLLKELIIKRQHNCKTTGFWRDNSVKYNFLLLAHEYLPVFEKPVDSPGNLAPVIGQEKCGPTASVQTDIENEGLETTTVWLFDDNDFETAIDKNIYGRYGSEGSEDALLFIKGVKDCDIVDEVTRGLANVKKGGHCVVQTIDARCGKYIRPSALEIHNRMKTLPIRIKEIVIAAPKLSDPPPSDTNVLAISHHYLLIYSKL